MLVQRQTSQLVLIDIQARLVPAVENGAQVVENAIRLVRYANRLEVPITITEQMPERIGATLPELRDIAVDATCLSKTTFSSLRTEAILDRLAQLRQRGRPQMIVAGMEAHVCVLQTVLDLVSDGYSVFVVSDAVGSRVPANRAQALARMAQAGAVIVTQEMIAFEWLERADGAAFKDMLPLIK